MLTGNNKWKRNLTIAVMIAPALIVAVGIVIYPILNTIYQSFLDPDTGAFTVQNYVYLFTNKLTRNHLIYTLEVTLLGMVFSICVAYLLAMYLRFSNSKISKFIGTLYLLPRFIPSLVAVYAMKLIISDSGLLNRLSLLLPETCALYDFKPGVLYNIKGLLIMELWFNVPFATMIITAALSGISDSIIESARDVGAGKIRIFFKMILPLSIGDVLIAATFIFMGIVSSFTTPYLIGQNNPLMLGVYLRKQFSSRNYELAAATSVIIFLLSSISATVYIYTNLKEKAWEKS